jgi:ppGpp synthetase/RelA/SpoT-type nucleotidyltranferase
MDARTAEDRLREEYFSLLPQVRLVAEELEAEIRFLLVPLMRHWESHERIMIKSRIKDCESALASLRRRAEMNELDDPSLRPRTLRSLNDLAGVRVLAFPARRVTEIDRAFRDRFADWTADPVPPTRGTSRSLALKYHGYCKTYRQIRAEVQIMSMLIGMYWEVEHGAMYKPGDRLRNLEVSVRMQDRSADVIRAMQAFEEQFEALTFVPPSPAELVSPD